MLPERFSLAIARTLRGDNARLLGKLLVVVTMMFAFGYALVPMYKSICNVLGINVLSRSELETSAAGSPKDGVNSQVDASRTVTIEFDANVRGPWDFKPAQRSIDVHPGQMVTVMYEFRNRQNRTMVAQAIPSYAPAVAMASFNKLECFCFKEQTLAPNEARQWPVVFVVDRKLPRDIRTITLSYTFFEVGGRVPAEPTVPSESARAPVAVAPEVLPS